MNEQLIIISLRYSVTLMKSVNFYGVRNKLLQFKA